MPGGKPGNMPGATGEETKEILTNPVKGSKYGFRKGNYEDALDQDFWTSF